MNVELTSLSRTQKGDAKVLAKTVSQATSKIRGTGRDAERASRQAATQAGYAIKAEIGQTQQHAERALSDGTTAASGVSSLKSRNHGKLNSIRTYQNL